MKKLLFLCLLALCLTTSCSKSKNEQEDTASAKTVDLGEASEDENDAKADKDDNAKGDDVKKKAKEDDGNRPSSKRDKKHPEKDALKPDKDTKKPPVKEDKEPDKKETDTKPVRPVKPEAPSPVEDTAQNNPPEEETNGFDFSDDDEIDVKPAAKRPPREPRQKPNLEIEKYITIREFREQTGYAKALAEDWLVGQRSDARYASHRLATANNAELGFSIQIWRPGNETAASKRFSDLYAQSFGGQKLKSVATDAFVSKHHKIVELGFFEKGKRATVLLSCSDNICSQEQLASIALIIQRRL